MCREIPLLGGLTLRGFACWDSASLETRCDERPNDHLLLFVSKSTKQHLFLRAWLEFAVMDVFWKLFSWRSDGVLTARVTFTILRVTDVVRSVEHCARATWWLPVTRAKPKEQDHLYCSFVTFTHLKPVQSTELRFLVQSLQTRPQWSCTQCSERDTRTSPAVSVVMKPGHLNQHMKNPNKLCLWLNQSSGQTQIFLLRCRDRASCSECDSETFSSRVCANKHLQHIHVCWNAHHQDLLLYSLFFSLLTSVFRKNKEHSRYDVASLALACSCTSWQTEISWLLSEMLVHVFCFQRSCIDLFGKRVHSGQIWETKLWPALIFYILKLNHWRLLLSLGWTVRSLFVVNVVWTCKIPWSFHRRVK